MSGSDVRFVHDRTEVFVTDGETTDTTTKETLTVESMPEEVTRRNVHIIAQLEAAARGRRSFTDRIVDGITAFCGTTAFVWLHVAWFGGWVAWNTLPGLPRFDAFPFQFLTLVVSLEAILLSTFILITQNRQAIIADRRNHLDLQINMLAEQENTAMLTVLHAIARKLEVVCTDSEIEALEKAAQAETMVEQIEEMIEHEETAQDGARQQARVRETDDAAPGSR